MNFNSFFTGRIARLNYFLSSLVMGAAAWIFILLVAVILGKVVGAIALILTYVVLIFFSISLIIRRCHDLGWSGWWTLLMFIPFVNVVIGLIILFKRGEQAPNAYGAVASTAVNVRQTLFPKSSPGMPSPVQ